MPATVTPYNWVLEVLETKADAREQRRSNVRVAAQLLAGKPFETLQADTLPAPADVQVARTGESSVGGRRRDNAGNTGINRPG